MGHLGVNASSVSAPLLEFKGVCTRYEAAQLVSRRVRRERQDFEGLDVWYKGVLSQSTLEEVDSATR